MIVALDIGTTKVAVAVGEQSPSGELTILGTGEAHVRGLRNGMVVDMDQTVGAIRLAIANAEKSAKCYIDSVVVGVGGSSVKAFRSRGITEIHGSHITSADIARVHEIAQAAAIPNDREVVYVLPQEFVVDGLGGIKTPYGITGKRLEADVLIVVALRTAVRSINRSVELAGLKVSGTLFQALASAQSVLTEEERALGTCIVDIGGGTTDLAVFVDGALIHATAIPVGGELVTNDVVIGLRTPLADAERIKREHGCALAAMCGPEELIDVPSMGDRPPRKIARQILGEIIEPRMAEIFELVLREIRACGAEDELNSGLVVTGGSSLLVGIEELAEQVLALPVRRGVPWLGEEVISDPRLATAVGLLQLRPYLSDESRPWRVPRAFVKWISDSFR